MTLVVLISLFALGLTTGFIGTNTGGSVLITVPAMIFFGIPSSSAIATSRIASLGTMVAGLYHFRKRKKIDYTIALAAAGICTMGALIGSLFLVALSLVITEKIVGIIILTLLVLSFFFKNHLQKNINKPVSPLKKILGYLLFLFSGIVGGFFGAQSVISTYILSFFFHKSLSESIGTRKLCNLLATLSSILVYGWCGMIDWVFGGALIMGTIIGAAFGSSYALKKGDAWISNLFTVVLVVVSVILIMKSQHQGNTYN